MARFPAVPRLVPRLRDGALVVLDDTNRRPEREATKRWAASASSSGRSLRIVKDVGRSTVLEVRASNGPLSSRP